MNWEQIGKVIGPAGLTLVALVWLAFGGASANTSAERQARMEQDLQWIKQELVTLKQSINRLEHTK